MPLDNLTRVTRQHRWPRITADRRRGGFALFLNQFFAGTAHEFLEATGGVALAYARKPDPIFPDLVMPGISGFDALTNSEMYRIPGGFLSLWRGRR